MLWKRGGAISPLFNNILNISLTSGVKLIIHLLNVVVRFIVFLISATLIFRGTDIYLEVFHSPLEFEITRVDCIFTTTVLCHKCLSISILYARS